ncbi:MAG: type III pantothenate kinase [Pelagibacterales bacterium]|nr:type III pantothenate kinase [Pelagibacterales bacterium]
MKLVADIGNSTIQIALWKNKSLQRVLQFETSSYKKMNFHLSKYKNNLIESIFFSCVTEEKVANDFKRCAKKIFKCKVEQIKSSSKLFGVVNGYKQPTKLGDDRWVTIVASHLLYQKPLMIADCGTAISIDVVNIKGIHLGGYILGGFDGYTKSFKDVYHLKNIKIKEGSVLQKKSFPKKTEDGITEGYLLMVVSAIENAYNQIKKNQKALPKVLISGGYGKIISKRLSIKNKYEPNLVLRCLGLIANQLSK